LSPEIILVNDNNNDDDDDKDKKNSVQLNVFIMVFAICKQPIPSKYY
jgi:hypothetical protein